MPGLDPGTHVFHRDHIYVDGRDKPGHDGALNEGKTQRFLRKRTTMSMREIS